MGSLRTVVVESLLAAFTVLTLVGCATDLTTIVPYRSPMAELSRNVDASGAWLGSMPGANGIDIQELTDGDLLLLGEAQSLFVQRLSPDGEQRWTLPFQGCGSPRVALSDDGAIYVLIKSLLAVGAADVAKIRDKAEHCKAAPTPDNATVLRVNGRGEVVWRWVSNVPAWSMPDLLSVPGGVLVMTHGASIADEPSSTIVKLNAQRDMVWEQPQKGSISLAALAPSGRILLGIEGSSSEPCSVRALDASTGATHWQASVGTDVVDTRHSCDALQLSVTSAGSVLWWRSGEKEVLNGLDPEPGTQLWTRDITALEGGFSPTRAANPSELALFVRSTPNQNWRRGRDATLIGVEPASGRAQLLARLEESIPNFVASGPYIASASWGRRSLLLTGGFHGSLTLRELHAEGGSYSITDCLFNDRGYYVPGSFVPPPPRPRRVYNPWRGGVGRIVCPSANPKLRVRAFLSSLYVAKLPMNTL